MKAYKKWQNNAELREICTKTPAGLGLGRLYRIVRLLLQVCHYDIVIVKDKPKHSRHGSMKAYKKWQNNAELREICTKTLAGLGLGRLYRIVRLLLQVCHYDCWRTVKLLLLLIDSFICSEACWDGHHRTADSAGNSPNFRSVENTATSHVQFNSTHDYYDTVVACPQQLQHPRNLKEKLKLHLLLLTLFVAVYFLKIFISILPLPYVVVLQ
jgi:hypothetical protein